MMDTVRTILIIASGFVLGHLVIAIFRGKL